MQRFLSFFIGFLVGALVGGVAAIMLAPTSGEELRVQIQDRAATMREEVKHAAAERRAELEQQLATMRSPQPPPPAK